MKKKQCKTFMCDFETTVFKNQTFTEVWASACVELFTEDVKIFNSIEQQFEYFKSLKTNIIAYYHNLKFDGAFWLSYFLVDLNLKQALEKTGENDLDIRWLSTKDMPNNSVKYSISDMGQWYTITVKIGGKIIEFRDSLKLLPYSVSKIGKSFGTKHKKLEMEYEGFRYAGCEITDKEKEYIANDVLVVKEALEIMFKDGHDKLTIGACCLSEFRKDYPTHDHTWDVYFPELHNMYLPKEQYGSDNVDRYIRKSYKGGWCYLVKGKENEIFTNGTTADVNSLYPSMMHSESGNRYPIGEPHFWYGNYIPDVALESDKYYFVRVKTRFYIKKNYLPFIQIKGSLLYSTNECLTSSDVVNPKNGKKYNKYYNFDNELTNATVEMTLTMTDYELIKEHYDLVDFEILDGCWFESKIGLFDNYINKYRKIKTESKGAVREEAKLFLNNLYGKMASSTVSSFKVAYIKDDKSLGFYCVDENNKKAGFIPIGSAITSYARNFTIRAAQKNYYGSDKRGFIYADTDSIHCDLEPHEIKGITVHDKNFCCWKLESNWDKAIFARQKTYIERVVAEDGQPVDKPYYTIKCAGMPQRCKDLFEKSMQGYIPIENDNFTEEQLKFLSVKRTMNDFCNGLIVPGKLLPKRIKGGIILVDTTYEMRY